MPTDHSTLIGALKTIVGPRHVKQQPNQIRSYLAERRNHYAGDCIAVVLPNTTQQVSDCVKACAKHKTSIVPQGGNTGLCGGTVSNREQIILSTNRLNSIRGLDEDNYSMTVESGAILADIQTAAQQQDRFFPLSLGAQGSCQIGGNLSTNAGGMNVLRYGNTRDLCLGIEVVLANGDVLSDLTGLRKNNTGYDLKNLFIGAEGTLGIITAATLKLFPQPKWAATALIAVPKLQNVAHFFSTLREASSDQISTFELIPRLAIELTEQYFPEHKDHFSRPYPWYVLTVLHGTSIENHVENCLDKVLTFSLRQSWISDAVVAQNETQTEKLMLLREQLVETQRRQGACVSHDIAVPISSIPAFISQAEILIEKIMPAAQPYAFGHYGDGNIHYNVLQPSGIDTAVFSEAAPQLTEAIYNLVNQFEGSFSAEHGIGLLKRQTMAKYKHPVAIEAMKAIKAALDPDGIFNPDKVIPS